jgi:hypothetical protein
MTTSAKRVQKEVARECVAEVVGATCRVIELGRKKKKSTEFSWQVALDPTRSVTLVFAPVCAIFHKVPIRLARSTNDMVAFAASIIVTMLLVWGVNWYQKRCPQDKVFTWGEAMAFATYVFLILFWVYGVVPHQWLTWADSELNWRPDRYVVGPTLFWTGDQGIVEWALPFTTTYQLLRDFIAVGIYIGILAGNVSMWRSWQERGQETTAPTPTSEYGRPLLKEGAGA